MDCHCVSLSLRKSQPSLMVFITLCADAEGIIKAKLAEIKKTFLIKVFKTMFMFIIDLYIVYEYELSVKQIRRHYNKQNVDYHNYFIETWR